MYGIINICFKNVIQEEYWEFKMLHPNTLEGRIFFRF
jgi:hypothetical protein